jgi:hypothetical protein
MPRPSSLVAYFSLTFLLAWAVWLAAGALVAAVCSEVARPIPLRPFPPATADPAAYEWLARQPCAEGRCAVLELPAGATWEGDAPAVYSTLAHGHSVVNGYSGFAPAAYPLVVSLAAQLPEATARETLERLTGARWLLVHRARLTAEEREAWDGAGPTAVARFGDDVVYAMAGAADWRDRYVAAPPDATFAGTPLEPLPAGSRAALALEVPTGVRPRGVLRAAALVTNLGNVPWPALTSRSRNRVTLSLTWVGRKGRVRTLPVTTVVLPTDLRPNERVRVATRLAAPSEPGTYAIFARVQQEGMGPLDGTARAIVRVAP